MGQKCLVAPEHGGPPRLQPQRSAGGHASAEGVFDPSLVIILPGQHILRKKPKNLAAHDQAAGHVGWVERLDYTVRVELNVESTCSNDKVLLHDQVSCYPLLYMFAYMPRLGHGRY